MKVSILNLYVRKPALKCRKQNAQDPGKVSKMCSSWRLHLTFPGSAGHRHGGCRAGPVRTGTAVHLAGRSTSLPSTCGALMRLDWPPHFKELISFRPSSPTTMELNWKMKNKK